MSHRKSALAVLLGMAALPMATSSATGVNVTWTLQGVTLTDGTSMTGSFVYNAETNVFSSINLATLNGTAVNGTSPVSGGTFNYVAPVSSTEPVSANGVVFVTTGNIVGFTNQPAIYLILSPPMSDAGGTINIAGDYVTTCGNSTCTELNLGNMADTRILGAGTIVGTVPTPVGAPALSPLATVLMACVLLAAGRLAMRQVHAV